MAFNVSIIQAHSKLIRMSGSLNLASSEEIYTDLFETLMPGDEIVFDVSDIQDISSAGIRAILRLQRRVTEQSGRFVVTGVSAELEEILFLTGFLEHINIEGTSRYNNRLAS